MPSDLTGPVITCFRVQAAKHLADVEARNVIQGAATGTFQVMVSKLHKEHAELKRRIWELGTGEVGRGNEGESVGPVT